MLLLSPCSLIYKLGDILLCRDIFEDFPGEETILWKSLLTFLTLKVIFPTGHYHLKLSHHFQAEKTPEV